MGDDLLSKVKDIKKVINKSLEIDVSDDNLGNWLDLLEYKNFKKGTFLLKQGAKFDEIGFLLKGALRFFYVDLDGKDITKYFMSSDEVLLTSATIANIESEYYIEVIEDCQILLGKYDEIMESISDNVFWKDVLNKGITNQLLYNEYREASFLNLTASQRYENFLEKNRHIESYARQKDIASYLGISPESLSRIRKKMNLT